jgi:hypothetical protein
LFRIKKRDLGSQNVTDPDYSCEELQYILRLLILYSKVKTSYKYYSTVYDWNEMGCPAWCEPALARNCQPGRTGFTSWKRIFKNVSRILHEEGRKDKIRYTLKPLGSKETIHFYKKIKHQIK